MKSRAAVRRPAFLRSWDIASKTWNCAFIYPRLFRASSSRRRIDAEELAGITAGNHRARSQALPVVARARTRI